MGASSDHGCQISRNFDDWAMDFRATIPYLICIVGSICAVFAFTFYEIHSLSKKYDTGVAMVVKED